MDQACHSATLLQRVGLLNYCVGHGSDLVERREALVGERVDKC